MTSGSFVKRPIMTGAKRKNKRPISSAQVTPMKMPKRVPFFARSNFCAPMFCEVKVVRAMLKLMMGRKAKPSTLK